jgi:hypothetical protein
MLTGRKKGKYKVKEDNYLSYGKHVKNSKHCYNPITLERKRINNNSELPDGFIWGRITKPYKKRENHVPISTIS